MSELPAGWAKAKLSDLADFNPKHDPGKLSETVSFVPMPAVSAEFGTIEGAADRPLADVWKGFSHFAENDVIFAKITPCMENGKIAVAQGLTSGLGCGSTEFHVLRSNGSVLPEYLWRFLRQSSFRRDAEGAMTGAVGQRRVPTDYLKASELPVPPLAEQRRIVAKLDALTARTARARADLDPIRTLAARYKQAVLARIFGELDCQPEKLVDLVDPARGIPYGIVQTGVGMPSGVPTVRCGDVRQFSVAKDGLKLVAQDIADAYPRTLLRGGEVLLAIRGSVGNSAVVGPEFAGCNISREVAMIPAGDRLRPRFVMFFLGSPEAQAYLKRHIKGVAQTGINLEDVRSLTLPVPDLHVQDVVIEKIDRALAEIDRLTAEAAAARRLLDQLDQAILAKAFRGELVPQDPADEPASVTLERIRAERAAAPKPKRGRRKAAA